MYVLKYFNPYSNHSILLNFLIVFFKFKKLYILCNIFLEIFIILNNNIIIYPLVIYDLSFYLQDITE